MINEDFIIASMLWVSQIPCGLHWKEANINSSSIGETCPSQLHKGGGGGSAIFWLSRKHFEEVGAFRGPKCILRGTPASCLVGMDTKTHLILLTASLTCKSGIFLDHAHAY